MVMQDITKAVISGETILRTGKETNIQDRQVPVKQFVSVQFMVQKLPVDLPD